MALVMTWGVGSRSIGATEAQGPSDPGRPEGLLPPDKELEAEPKAPPTEERNL